MSYGHCYADLFGPKNEHAIDCPVRLRWERDTLREAIGVMVPVILRCYIDLMLEREPSTGRDVDLEGARNVLNRVNLAMTATEPR